MRNDRTNVISVPRLIVLLAVILVSGSADAADSVLAEGATIEKIAGGHRFTEGPAVKDGVVYYTDIPNNLIMRLDPVSKKAEKLYKDTRGCNGLMFDSKGRLIACSHGRRAVVRYEEDGRLTTLADQFDGKKLNSPNDLSIDKTGGLYFTDPRYGRGEPLEQPVMGLYYLTADGKVTRVDDQLKRPNGLILSPDQKTLYVSDADGKTIYAYDVERPGKLADKRVFAKVPDEHARASDGMTVDRAGNVYGTCMDGIRVWNPKGELIETIKLPAVSSNCTFDEKEEYLYITARDAVYRIRMRAKAPN